MKNILPFVLFESSLLTKLKRLSIEDKKLLIKHYLKKSGGAVQFHYVNNICLGIDDDTDGVVEITSVPGSFFFFDFVKCRCKDV